MTYQEQFDQYLHDRIQAGGDLQRVVTLVNAYQGTDRVAREGIFQEWLEEASCSCGRCGAQFKPDVAKAEEDDQALCMWCARGLLGLGLGQEPVTGWRRTWSR